MTKGFPTIPLKLTMVYIRESFSTFIMSYFWNVSHWHVKFASEARYFTAEVVSP